MSANDTPGALGDALVAFTTSGAFPEEHVSSLQLDSKQLPPAIQALSEAKSKLEVCPLIIIPCALQPTNPSSQDRNPHH